MKIPFFYLDVGKIQVFQPQNKHPDPLIPYNRNLSGRGDLKIMSCSMPEIVYDTLFLNGDTREESYRYCVNVNNSATPSMTELIETLKQVEV